MLLFFNNHKIDYYHKASKYPIYNICKYGQKVQFVKKRFDEQNKNMGSVSTEFDFNNEHSATTQHYININDF